ncbi:MAG: molybdopterin-guanine dinucleotide biosynthesis protein A [Proteobacteria bacterium]|nr:molybdopterin-guanine dinucleotide biosynthesis protein A [Pseudomonadota bacterium]MDA1059216.1 molybdopterin-guanine dinucleotide biosynthesis protein A [Pseudomonadota bacterium]
MRHYLRTAAVCLFFLTLVPGIATAQEGNDRHEGYYYPEPKSQETYVARAVTLPQASRQSRIGFVTGMTAQQLRAPYPPQFAIFAKGDGAQKLIIVGLNESAVGTVYRARALLAQLTAQVRTTQFFQEMGVTDFFTFFDMAKMMGFEQITVSDGDTFSHQVLIR